MIGRQGWQAVGAPESIRRRVAVAGRVFDAKTQTPVPAAVVELCALTEPATTRWRQTMTRADGTYAFAGLPEGKYRVHVYSPHTGSPYSEFTGDYQVPLQDAALPPQWTEVPLLPRTVAEEAPAVSPPVVKPTVRLTRRRRGTRDTQDDPSEVDKGLPTS
jgi:hypothetical protein